MSHVHIKNLEKHHPGYKDRNILWAKIYIDMASGDPEFELIDNEIDKWRFVAMILLELRAKKPLPNNDRFWRSKGFDLKKRPMTLTLNMLHNFLECCDEEIKTCGLDKDKDKEKEKEKEPITKNTHSEFVLLTTKEYDKLVVALGHPKTEEYITRLNNYIGSKGKRYKSHYHTILTWASGEPKPEKSKGEIERAKTKAYLDTLK